MRHNRSEWFRRRAVERKKHAHVHNSNELQGQPNINRNSQRNRDNYRYVLNFKPQANYQATKRYNKDTNHIIANRLTNYNCNEYEYRNNHVGEPIDNHSSQPHWYGIQQLNFEKYSENEYWKSESLLKCKQRIGHYHYNATTKSHEQSLDSNLVFDIYRPAEISSGLRQRSTYITLDQNNNHMYTNTSIKTETGAQIWQNDIQGVNSEHRDVEAVSNRFPYRYDFHIGSYPPTRKGYSQICNNQCCRDAGNQCRYAVCNKVEMERNSNSDFGYIDNPLQDVDYRKVNMISTDHGICKTTSGETSFPADTDMRINREHKPPSPWCYRSIEAPLIPGEPVLQHAQVLAMPTSPLPYVSLEPFPGERCLPKTETPSTQNKRTCTSYLGTNQEVFEHLQNTEQNDSPNMTYQLVNSTYNVRDTSFSNEINSDFLQPKCSMPSHTFKEEQTRKEFCQTLRGKPSIENPRTKRIIRDISSSTPEALALIYAGNSNNEGHCQKQISISDITIHRDDELQKNCIISKVPSDGNNPRLSKRKRDDDDDDEDGTKHSIDLEQNSDADKHEQDSVLPPKRRKKYLFRPWSNYSLQIQAGKVESQKEISKHPVKNRENESCQEKEKKTALNRLTISEENIGITSVAGAIEGGKRDDSFRKQYSNEVKKTSNQTGSASNKDPLYKVSHVNLNMKAIKRSLVSVRSTDIKTQTSVFSSVTMPALDVSSSTLTKIENPSIKLQCSMNTGRTAVFKAWEEALVKTKHNSLKSRTNNSEDKREDFQTGKVKQSTRSKFKKQIDLLKLVEKNIRTRNARYVLQKKTSIGQHDSSITLNMSHDVEEKSAVSNIHPKLRHKLSKPLATDEDGEILVICKSADTVEPEIIETRVKDMKETEVENKESPNEDESRLENQDSFTGKKDSFTGKRYYRKGVRDSFVKEAKTKGDTKLDKNKHDENQKYCQTYFLSRNGTKETSTYSRGQALMPYQNTFDVKQIQMPKVLSKSPDLHVEKNKAVMFTPLSTDDMTPTHNRAKNKNTKCLKSFGNCIASRNIKNRNVCHAVDSSLCVSNPKSPENTCYAVQALNGPRVSSTYYKDFDEDCKKMKVIRHAKEALIGYSSNMEYFKPDDTFVSCSYPFHEKERNEDKPLAKDNGICISVSPNLVIDISPSLSCSMKDLSNQEGDLIDSTEMAKNMKKDEVIKSGCYGRPLMQDVLSARDYETNDELVINIPSSLSTLCTDVQSDKKEPARIKPKGYADVQMEHLSLEMHMKYMHARNELEIIDGQRPFLPPLPAFVPAPVESPLYSGAKSVPYTDFNVNSYSPTQEDFERYKHHQKQRLCHRASPPLSPPPVNYLYGDSTATRSREVPNHFVECQHDVKGKTLKPSNISFQKSRDFISLYNCDSTTQTYDDMINDVSSTVMFDTNIVQDIDKVIEEVVTKTCDSPELESLVTDFTLLSEEKFENTNLEGNIANKEENSLYSGRNVENTDLNINQDAQNLVPFHSGVRPRYRYTKRFPSDYPKVKPEKHSQEMELYKAASNFLGDFDRSNKRACRKQNVSVDKSYQNHEKENKIDNQLYEHGNSQNEYKEKVARRLQTISQKNERDNLKNDEEIEDKTEKKSDDKSEKKEKPKTIAKLKISELLKKCKSRIPIFSKIFCKQGKMFTMRKQFDMNSRQQYLKNGENFNYNKTPFIKVENMKSREKSKVPSKINRDLKEQSRSPMTTKKNVSQKLCYQKSDRNLNQQKLHDQTSNKRTCKKCNKDFENNSWYNRHLKRNHDIPIFCGVCGVYFTYKDGYYRHLKSLMHCKNLEKFPGIPNKPSIERPKTGTDLNNSVISISSETSTDDVSIHYVSSCSEDVLPSPERKVKKNNIKSPHGKKDIKSPHGKKDIKSPHGKNDIKSPQVQKCVKTLQVEKRTKSPHIRKPTKSPLRQKCTKSPQLHKRKATTKILKDKPVRQQEMVFCDPCRQFYKKLPAHIKTEKHLRAVKMRKKEMRQKKMKEAKHQLCKEKGRTKFIQNEVKKQKMCKGKL